MAGKFLIKVVNSLIIDFSVIIFVTFNRKKTWYHVYRTCFFGNIISHLTDCYFSNLWNYLLSIDSFFYYDFFSNLSSSSWSAKILYIASWILFPYLKCEWSTWLLFLIKIILIFFFCFFLNKQEIKCKSRRTVVQHTVPILI